MIAEVLTDFIKDKLSERYRLYAAWLYFSEAALAAGLGILSCDLTTGIVAVGYAAIMVTKFAKLDRDRAERLGQGWKPLIFMRLCATVGSLFMLLAAAFMALISTGEVPWWVIMIEIALAVASGWSLFNIFRFGWITRLEPPRR